jgi:signal transduction histidine kinase
VGSNTVITDLTEIMEAKRLKEKAAEEIKRDYQMRQEVLNIAAHELRTPIQPILGYVELFKKGLIEPAVAINSIQESAIRLRELADNLLVVGRIEGGNLSYDMQTMQAEPMIKELAKFARITIESLGKSEHVRLVTRSEPIATAAVLCVDQGRILQALENILNNSIKFTNKGEITIETCIIDDKQLFEIKISDTGPGIPPALLPRLFEKFARKGHDNPVTSHKGTGLGLFITKSIIQAHDGEIFGYNNEGNNGATFVTRLPLQTESQPPHTGMAA